MPINKRALGPLLLFLFLGIPSGVLGVTWVVLLARDWNQRGFDEVYKTIFVSLTAGLILLCLLLARNLVSKLK